MKSIIDPSCNIFSIRAILLYFTTAYIPMSASASEASATSCSAPSFAPIEFKAGRPLATDSLEAAIASPKKRLLAVLQSDLDTIKGLPHIRFEVAGFTDNRECSGDGCAELSIRRATFVRNWLLAGGVPAIQLTPAEGMGSDMPIHDNSSRAGRSRNRRVEISIDGRIF